MFVMQSLLHFILIGRGSKMTKYTVYAKFNGKWKKIKTFDDCKAAKIEMRKQVYLWFAEAATVEREI